MNPFEATSLQLILVFFVPGFISMKVYDLLVPSERRDFSKSVLEAVSFSCINFGILYWTILAIHRGALYAERPGLYYMALIAILFLAPILWPVVYLRILDLPLVKRRTIQPFPKPWDYVFSNRESYWVILHLRDGRRIGGRFDTRSFASSYPADEQIYLEEVWQLDSDGKFLKKVDRTQGVIVTSADFQAIELFQ